MEGADVKEPEFCKECENVRYYVDKGKLFQYTVQCECIEWDIIVNGVKFCYDHELFCFVKVTKK